ncbi:hypothetical protein [Microbacterium allomyrinae]|uniref:Uncharacterized protein n=1 Tax=Microbacterium allomyrinae TaxID=2830666 RepID=A0A9X1LVZ2_9MICO|nr:hypothetical protein [Microbacterium allomyrinae]MCC2033094.1 hypothetical protein [Microbacterium allomyrinae]
MSTFDKGDYVVAAADGAGDRASSSGRVAYRAGDEFEVTSVYSDHLNVRMVGGGAVFRVPRERVHQLPRKIGEVPEGSIHPEHPGLSWLFDDAARMADRLGLCHDYDRLCDALGIPGRVRTFTVKVLSAEGIEVTAKVQARSQSLAEQRVRAQFAPAAPLALEQIR